MLKYIYEYDPHWSKLSNLNIKHLRNGDIAIVKISSSEGLNLRKYSAVPICLPAPTTFAPTNTELKHVTLAGSGRRYASTYDDKMPDLFKPLPFTSCYTNEAMVKDIEGIRRSVFLQCQGDPTADTACIEWKNIEMKGTEIPKDPSMLSSISTMSEMKFSKGPDGYNRAELILHRDDKCAKYWDKAERAYAKHQKLSSIKESPITQHRIVIIKANSEGDFLKEIRARNWNYILNAHIVCYNIKMVAKYGICKTKTTVDLQYRTPYSWGFCSRSCEAAKQSFDVHSFEETEITYHEKPPKDSLYAKDYASAVSNQHSKNISFSLL